MNLKRTKGLKRGGPLPQMSTRQRQRFADAGVAFPMKTFLPWPREAKAAKMSTGAAKRPADTGFDKTTVDAILDRDGYACARCGGALWGDRGLHYSIQHRRARGAGGTRRPDTNAPQNGIALCGSATSAGGCHEWVESHRTEAEEHGWAVDQNADPLTKAVDHHLHGWIFLYSNGSWGSRPEEACA